MPTSPAVKAFFSRSSRPLRTSVNSGGGNCWFMPFCPCRMLSISFCNCSSLLAFALHPVYVSGVLPLGGSFSLTSSSASSVKSNIRTGRCVTGSVTSRSMRSDLCFFFLDFLSALGSTAPGSTCEVSCGVSVPAFASSSSAPFALFSPSSSCSCSCCVAFSLALSPRCQYCRAVSFLDMSSSSSPRFSSMVPACSRRLSFSSRYFWIVGMVCLGVYGWL